MATVRTLRKSPLVEALVDLRAEIGLGEPGYQSLIDDLKAGYPEAERREGTMATLEVKDSKLVAPRISSLGFQGFVAKSADQSLIAQFKPQGFTLNNVKGYVGGERLIREALALWLRFAAVAGPVTVTRVAMRYINQLELPLADGDSLDLYLTMGPVVPTGAPDRVGEFLSRITLMDGESTTRGVIVTQRLTPAAHEGADPVLLLDVDAFETGQLSSASEQLGPVLNRLRDLKNRTFFAMVTDAALRRYD